MRSRCSTSRRVSRRASVRFKPEGWLSSRSAVSFRRAERDKKRMTMKITLPRRCDRAGHAWAGLLVAILICMAPRTALAQWPGDYKAQRFDVLVTPRGGDLDVREVITFEFQSGTFRKVWRDLPSSGTDGIEIVEAGMDGAALSRGEGQGQFAVSGRSRIRVQWNFAPQATPSVHKFELRYLARGAIYRDHEWDVVRWRALPAEHRYTIDASRIAFAAEDPQLRPAEARRVQSVSLLSVPPGVVIEALGVRSNGWVIGEVRFPAGSMITTLPAWQQTRERAAALGPRWLMGGGAILFLSFALLFGIRQGYPSPSVDTRETTTTSPPAALPAALASVLAARGRVSGYQSTATLLDLADRGVLVVRELPRVLGTRQYEIAQVPGKHDIADHEEEAIRLAFGGHGDPVTLSKVRGRLARSGRRFTAAVNADLESMGLIDPDRKAVRDRLTGAAMAMLLIGAASNILAAPLIPRFEAWPFVLPVSLMVAGIIGVIMAASMTPLSDQGLIEGARWAGFRRHLKALAGQKEPGAIAITPRWIVYGIAVGLAPQWSRYLRAHPAAAPSWFVPATQDDHAAFAAFVGGNVAASAGHSGGGGGGAAGGGGSGAG